MGRVLKPELALFRCTANALNGTDVQGQILLCFPFPGDRNAFHPLAVFAQASQFVIDGKGIGLIFAQHTTDILEVTADNCQGIACVIVDFDTATKIRKYWAATRYVVPSKEFDIKPVLVIDGDNNSFFCLCN